MKIKRGEGVFSIIMVAISAIVAIIILRLVNSLKVLVDKVLILIIFLTFNITLFSLSSPIKVVEKDIFTSKFIKKNIKKSNKVKDKKDEKVKDEGVEKDLINLEIVNLKYLKNSINNFIKKNKLLKSRDNIFKISKELYGSSDQYLLPFKITKYRSFNSIKYHFVNKDSINREMSSGKGDILPLDVEEFQGGIY